MRLLAGALLALAACLPEASPSPDAPSERTVRVTITGCAPTPASLTLVTEDGDAVRLVSDQPIDLPPNGAFMPEGTRLRDGNWFVWGTACLPLGRACPAVGTSPFRACYARRTSWPLDIVCLDGEGNEICQARMTE